uniref:Uncharacterized protein n=1 Tax=Plectus sambesii TaxID=2011161 RepID=A0A914WEH3_9BILA
MEGFSIVRLAVFAIVFAEFSFRSSLAAINNPWVNCSASVDEDASATLLCHTCMGGDSEGCNGGATCCTGSCFKLIDEEHDIVARGCRNESQEDGSVSSWVTNVKLYWGNNELLQGRAYYCNNENYCNRGSSLIASVILLLVTLGILKAR